jgi:hypothetical protein
LAFARKSKIDFQGGVQKFVFAGLFHVAGTQQCSNVPTDSLVIFGCAGA